MKIQYSTHFDRQYKKLPLLIQTESEKKEKIFRKNPFEPSLKTHKLKGVFLDFWAFSVTYSIRIIFEFETRKQVTFHAIGDHKIYND